ncbi:transmembrane protein, putative (macronuclear) [Tetrahymena thermophila SB210]|uniref:Transmembrane protein, putative n=1 Tax=Tetrahymena thermophila (strain SB210) TaxID=312017 RepID=Q22KD3_TETTS|nr:transmembrane protein, putative [Tetrahymena thermophila SB210]EAR85866.2 transmembrane protein, putative [Tetrahymena thermophila SB210]|eukprot:XP_001033529.2 transmembrane protein, putative [Tetrahymena thermophila SB210]
MQTQSRMSVNLQKLADCFKEASIYYYFYSKCLFLFYKELFSKIISLIELMYSALAKTGQIANVYNYHVILLIVMNIIAYFSTYSPIPIYPAFIYKFPNPYLWSVTKKKKKETTNNTNAYKKECFWLIAFKYFLQKNTKLKKSRVTQNDFYPMKMKFNDMKFNRKSNILPQHVNLISFTVSFSHKAGDQSHTNFFNKKQVQQQNKINCILGRQTKMKSDELIEGTISVTEINIKLKVYQIQKRSLYLFSRGPLLLKQGNWIKIREFRSIYPIAAGNIIDTTVELRIVLKV